jgi:iron complex transport system substrate-binding protein
MLIHRIAAIAAAVALFSIAASAEPVTVTDIAGRKVTVNVPVERVILGEGRQTYLTAVLDTENPFKRVVGWRKDLSEADPDSYAAYLEKFPEIAQIPTFGGFKDGSFDVEQAVALKPDVVIMNIESKQATEDARYIEKLAAVGIPLVYVDFRERPFANTEPSMRLFGQLYGKSARAEEFITWRNTQIERVTTVIEKAKPQRPDVFIERAGGYSEDCCMSFGDENFGKFVEMAGGTNIAKGIIPNTFGTLNPEQIIAANPDQIIVTGGWWEAYVPGGAWVGVAPGRDMAEAQRKLEGLAKRPAMTGVKAVEQGQMHAIWHQFYNSPYQFVGIQRMAKWLHPDLFATLDPEQTFRELHARFLPIAYRPGYWVSLTDAD